MTHLFHQFREPPFLISRSATHTTLRNCNTF